MWKLLVGLLAAVLLMIILGFMINDPKNIELVERFQAEDAEKGAPHELERAVTIVSKRYTRSRVYMVRDGEFGCHYMVTHDGGITPRLTAQGVHFCEEVSQ